MKTILFVFSVLVLFNIIACDDSGNSGSRCTFEEYLENVANTNCLAEELLFGCSDIGCRGFNPNFQTGFLDDCIAIDCQTLSCETLTVGTEEPAQPGLLTELTVDEITGFPIGIYQVDGVEGEFTCDIMFSN